MTGEEHALGRNIQNDEVENKRCPCEGIMEEGGLWSVHGREVA